MNKFEIERVKKIVYELSILIKECPFNVDEKIDKLLDDIVELKKNEHGKYKNGKMCCREG